MGQVTVTLNGRSYKLRCGDGEEPRLLAVAAHVDNRLAALTAEFGSVGDERILVMATLMIADELFDSREALAAVFGTTSAPGLRVGTDPIDNAPPAPQTEPADSGDENLELFAASEFSADPNRNAQVDQTLRGSRREAPVSINERLAEARERGVQRPAVK